jgi:hypothetical protein
MIRVRYRYILAVGHGRRPTLRGIARDRSVMVFITLAALALAAVLAHVMGERLELRRLSRESTAWASVAGVVLDTRAVWSSSPRSGRSYWPTTRYRYSVGRTAFVGDRVSFRPSYGRSEAEHAAAKYPPGSAVSVWYRPGDPHTSVLEPRTWDGVRGLTFLIPVTVATILLVLACVAALVFVSKPRR